MFFQMGRTCFFHGVFIFRRISSSYMPLSFVYFQDIFYFFVKSCVYVFQTFGNVLMYRTFAYSEFFRGTSYRCFVFNYIFSEFYGSVLKYFFHIIHSRNIFSFKNLYVKISVCMKDNTKYLKNDFYT